MLEPTARTPPVSGLPLSSLEMAISSTALAGTLKGPPLRSMTSQEPELPGVQVSKSSM